MYKDLITFYGNEVHHKKHAQAIADGFGLQVTSNIDEVITPYVVVFSYGDLKRVNKLNKKVIFCEHGVGMFYNEIHGSYAGSLSGRENVVLRLSPNKTHADKEKETLSCPVEIIGVPKLDKYTQRNWKVNKHLRVAISFHFDCNMCPETRTSFGYFKSALLELSQTFEMIGHGHPRIIEQLEPYYRAVGIPIKKDFESEVLEVADVYICDNSSTIFEFLITRKPIVLLNPPFYRKDIEHKGNPRFWKHSNIAPICERPEDLVKCVYEAVNNREKYLPFIEEARNEVLSILDGSATQRAVEVIKKYLV